MKIHSWFITMKSPFQNQIPATFIIIDLYWSKDKDFWSMNKTTTFTIQDYNKTQKKYFLQLTMYPIRKKTKTFKILDNVQYLFW